MDFLNLPKRTTGNRTYGLTSIIDVGTPKAELENFLSEYSHIIDIVKMGIGSAYITPNLKEKIELYKRYGIKPYCGGTLFEKCYFQKKIPEYLAKLRELGIEWIEISNGTIEIPLEERLTLVNNLKQEFHIIGEVGSKDAGKNMPVSQWKEEIKLLLEAGCDYVITEGRDSASSGIYEKNGKVKDHLIKELLEELDSKKIIFEAPTPRQQIYFIRVAGPNVNLGNVKLRDVLILESQRCGLKSETFYLEENKCKLPL